MTKCDFCKYSDFNFDTGKLECRYGNCILTKDQILEIARALGSAKK